MSSIRSEVVVEAPADRAFRVFTEKMETWWPASHHIGKVPFKTIVLDRRANGRWAEIGDDGSECDWGRVLVWDPPKRVVLGWQLTGNSTPIVGGSWIVALYSDDMDGQGLMTGLIAGPDIVPITGGVSPLEFKHKFTVSPPKPQLGLYQLTAVINHSPTGDPKKLSEMFGYAESTPIMITKIAVETN